MPPAMPGQFPRRFFLPALLVCFFLSGAAGLMDQVVWGKALGLVFGHTAYAVATVLAEFMAGLAAGSAWLGRWSEGRPRPIALYGLIELGVAASAAISLAGLAAVRSAYVAAFPHASGNPAALLALRFVGAGLVLFLPTFLMGGTLPVLVRGITKTSAELGARLSRLYWVNTAGAVTGTFAAGFLLLPVLGLRRTLALAVSLNTVAGALALWLARAEETSPASRNATPRQEASAFASPRRFFLFAFAIVGATAMVYEIAWTRLLSTQLGSSTYAFTLMLGTFLLGIVLGSALFERWSRRHAATSATFALTQTLTALAALAFLVFFSRLIEILPPILRATHESFRGLVLAQFATSALAMLPAAIVFGFNFPAAVLVIAGPKISDHMGTGAAVGRAYSWNTLGAIAGAVAGGFWLLPRLGSFHLIAVTAAANLALAAALALFAERRLRRILLFAANLILILAAGWIGFSPRFYDPAVASFNTVMYWNLYDRPLTPLESAHLVDVVYFRDGLNSTISVARTDDYLALRTNGKVDASNHDKITQLLLGHLGALAHAPRRVLLIGFGSGMTASALARYSEIERLDIVEIEPAVIAAAPLLVSLNHNVLQDPRVHMTLDDARNFLFTTRERYDLIISEPSNPWIAGVATLFTSEFYRAVQARLAPGGVFVQWVQAYSLFPEDLKMLAGTFLSEFHGATLWHGDAPDLILMAPSPPSGEILSRARNVYARPEMQEDFQQLGLEKAEGLFGFFLLDDAGLRKFTAGASINTDDLTLLEYHAPRSLLAHGLEDQNRAAILLHQNGSLPSDLPAADRDLALEAAADTSLTLDDEDAADRFLLGLDSRPATPAIAATRGRAALAHANYVAAFRAYNAALAMNPNFLPAQWGAAEADRKFGNNEKARQEFQAILAREPNHAASLDSLRALDEDFSRWDEAEEDQRRILAGNPHASAGAYAQLGEIHMRAGNFDLAASAFRDALARDPYNFQAHESLGQIFVSQKNWADARRELEFVRRYFPDEDLGAYPALFQVYNALGDPRAATEAARFGLRMFPDNSVLRRLISVR
jgi:spermidine synthase